MNSDAKRYLELLREWNTKINLFSRKMSPEALEISQYLDCEKTAEFVLKQSKEPVHDIGSGGGFPGIVIALRDRNREVHLYEKIQKKANFLKLVVGELGLNNVSVHGGLHDKTVKGIVTARAVFPIPKLFSFCKKTLEPGSILITSSAAPLEESPDLDFKFMATESYFLSEEFGSRSVAAFRFVSRGTKST